METFGRERRHRYYTVAAFRGLIIREGLDDSAAHYANIDHSAVGGFASVTSDAFYDEEETLVIYADSFKDKFNAGHRKYKLKNPILPDGSVKIGRPRKIREKQSKEKATIAEAGCKAGGKRKREEDQDDADSQGSCAETPVKPRRGRPPKKPRHDVDVGSRRTDQVHTQRMGEEGGSEVVIPRKRNRPPKKKRSDSMHDSMQETNHPEIDHYANTVEGMDCSPSSENRGRLREQKPGDQHTGNGAQQTAGEEGEPVSPSEDVHSKKRGHPVKQPQTPLPRHVESDSLIAQTSVHTADKIVLQSDNGSLSEFQDPSAGKTGTNSPQFPLQEARRSSRKRKQVVRDDNSISTKGTPNKNPAVFKRPKTTVQRIPAPASSDNGRVFVLPDVSPDRSLAMDQTPLQPSGSQPVVHSYDSHIAAASVPIDPALAMDAGVHGSETNVGVNSIPPSHL
jgi:oxalate---CoA ligase